VVERGKPPKAVGRPTPGNNWTRSDVTELSGLRDRSLDKPWRFQQKSSASSTPFARLLPPALAGVRENLLNNLERGTLIPCTAAFAGGLAASPSNWVKAGLRFPVEGGRRPASRVTCSFV
jgi:hypothetical protein